MLLIHSHPAVVSSNAITQAGSSYAGGGGSDLAIVLTDATFSDEDSLTHVRWMNGSLKQ